MKKNISLLIISLFMVSFLFAQEKMLIHRSGNVLYELPITEIDSIKFQNSSSYLNFNNSIIGIPITEIDSITFTDETINMGNIIYILYNEEDITIINPYEDSGVEISVDNFHVNVTATGGIENIEYHVSGTAEDGSLVINSDNSIKLTLSNLLLQNPSGTVIKISQDITTNVKLAGVNELADGTSGNAAFLSEGNIIFSGTGKLTVTGNKKHAISSSRDILVENGTIIIPHSASDGFHSEGFLMNNGYLEVTALGDGVDAGGGTFEINNGTIKVISTANDTKAIKSDDFLTINGGILDLNVSGDQSKAISGKENIVINGGEITIIASGGAVLEVSGDGHDPSYCTAVKTKKDIIVNNGTINIECTAANDGGKGFSADGNIVINDGNLTFVTRGDGALHTNEDGEPDSYSSCCIKSDLDISILGGTITCTSSGTAGKGIAADGTLVIGLANADNSNLILNVTTSGERFYVSGTGDDADYANPKAVKSEGNLTVNSGNITIACTQSDEGGEGLESKATLTINGGHIEINAYDDCINASDHIGINGGYIYCVSPGNDAIDSNGTLSISGGFVIASGTQAPEGGIDCDQNTFAITGGTVISTGGSTSNPTASASTNYSIIYNRATPGNDICIKNDSDEIILLFSLPTFSGSGSGGPGGPGGPGGNQMVVLFSDPQLSTGSYKLLYGGTITGGTTENGYNTGGSYIGGSTKSFTISGKVTTVN